MLQNMGCIVNAALINRETDVFTVNFMYISGKKLIPIRLVEVSERSEQKTSLYYSDASEFLHLAIVHLANIPCCLYCNFSISQFSIWQNLKFE